MLRVFGLRKARTAIYVFVPPLVLSLRPGLSCVFSSSVLMFWFLGASLGVFLFQPIVLLCFFGESFNAPRRQKTQNGFGSIEPAEMQISPRS